MKYLRIVGYGKEHIDMPLEVKVDGQSIPFLIGRIEYGLLLFRHPVPVPHLTSRSDPHRCETEAPFAGRVGLLQASLA